MGAIEKRVAALEDATGHCLRPWHRIIQGIGETVHQARCRYEKQNGPIPENDNIIIREIIEGGS